MYSIINQHVNYIKGARSLIGLLLAVFGLSVTMQAQVWTQLGPNIDGEDWTDNSGISVSVSADGTRMAVGAHRNDGNGGDSGHARVYEWNGTAWVQLGADIDGESGNDISGYSLSLSADGTRLAVGAPGNSDNGSYAGQVRVYEWNGSAWAQLGADLDGVASEDYFGWAVALSEDGMRLIASAYKNDDAFLDAGHVKVFDWNGNAWVQAGATLTGVGAGNEFGWSVAIASGGNRIAIGAPRNNNGGTLSGRVSVLEWNGTDWVQVGAAFDGLAGGNGAGSAVALSADGQVVAIGESKANDNSRSYNDAGLVRMYEWNAGSWEQRGASIYGRYAGSVFGSAVALAADGNTLIAGGYLNVSFNDARGYAQAYGWDGTDWAQLGANFNGTDSGDSYGYAVSVSANGSLFAVGAPGADGWGFATGVTQVYASTPTPLITAGATELLNVNPFTVSVNFGQLVTGFAQSDLVVSGGAVSGFSGSGGSYAFTVTPDGSSTVAISIDSNVVNEGNAASQLNLNYVGAPVGYCASSGALVGEDWIKRVRILNGATTQAPVLLDNFSGRDGGYGDYTDSVPAPSLAIGQSYLVVLNPGRRPSGQGRLEGYKVWVDWNRDGDFFDSGEIAYARNLTSQGGVQGVFAVPANANVGMTRMRVQVKHGQIPFGACEDFTRGEVEDYTINLTSASLARATLNVNRRMVNTDKKAVPAELLLYPNPARNEVKVACQMDMKSATTVLVYDLQGRQVYAKALGQTQLAEVAISVAAWKRGMYMVVISNANGQHSRSKLIVE